MKKIYLLSALVLLVLVVLTGCEKKEATQATPTPAQVVEAGTPESYTGIIGISKIIAHPALDDIERGLIDELKAQGYVNLKIDLQSANGEISTAASIANKFKNDDVAVAVGIATPMALSLANVLKDTPIVFSAVTDPVDAGLRSDINQENSNITGVSDMTPVQEQIELAAKLVELKKLGFIYNAGEANSVVLLNITQEVCDSMGIELVTATVTNTSEVKSATEALAPQVDAIYASTDNVVYASLGSLVPTAAKYNVPVIAAVPDSDPATQILASYGVDYYNAGRETGKVVIQILKGEQAGNIPVKFMTEPSELALYVSKPVADSLGITIPDEIYAQALNNQ